MAPIYLDHNGTTPIDPQVVEAMLPYLREHHGNPSSSHYYGRAAKAALVRAREQVAALLGCLPEEVSFTGGATEANNWVIKGQPGPRPHLVTTRVEHPSVLESCRYLERMGRAEVTYLEVDRQGLVDASQVSQALREDTRLISVMHANNETGALMPIARIVEAAGSVPVHTDAAQSVGKVPVKVKELGVAFLTLAGHKVYAPKGVGALYIRQGYPLEPLLHGAGHEGGRRSGTENLASIVGLGVACQLAEERLAESQQRLGELRDLLGDLLRDRTAGRVVPNGPQEPRLPNTLSLNFLGVTGAELLSRCPELAASTGPACHDGTVRLSHVLAAMGVDPQVGKGAVRLTLGRYTTEEQVRRAADLLVAAYHGLTVAPVEGGLGVA